jgi:hypothetical protein
MVLIEAKKKKAKMSSTRPAMTRQGTAPCLRAAAAFSLLDFFEIFLAPMNRLWLRSFLKDFDVLCYCPEEIAERSEARRFQIAQQNTDDLATTLR